MGENQMSKTIGQFTHVLYGGPENLTGPIVEICLDHWSKDKEGNVLISPHLMTDGEIDEHIDALIEDLEAVRSRAKRALAAKSPN